MIDDKFDEKILFWKYIDSEEDSIKLNLRKIFLTLDLVVINNNPLASVISYVKDNLLANTFYTNPLPRYVKIWIHDKHYKHIFHNDEVIRNRLEFLLYLQIVHHISTNKLTLKYTIKHKKVEDDLMPNKKWCKNKKKILKELGYSKLKTPMQKTLEKKKPKLTDLYKVVNETILSGENSDIIITNKNGVRQWFPAKGDRSRPKSRHGHRLLSLCRNLIIPNYQLQLNNL